MSPILNTKIAVEDRLKLQFPSTKIAWEGVSFKPPANQMYLHTQLVILTPDEPTIGDRYYRERIQFQVFVCDVLNKGTANALTVAEQIRALFDKGTTLVQNTSTIHIVSTPRIDSPTVTEDRLVVPVIIELWTEVYKD